MAQDNPNQPGTTKQQGHMAWLWRHYLRQHFWLLLAALFFMALEGSMLGAMSGMMKPMFDEIFVAGRQDLLLVVGLVFLAIFVIRALASVMQKFLLARLSQLSIAEIRQDLLAHLMRLDQAFHRDHPPGALMQRVEGDVESIKKVWQSIITGAGRDLVALITLFGVALWVDWKWTLFALIGVPILVAPSAALQSYVRGYARASHETSARLSTRLSEVFQGLPAIKLNGLEAYQSDRYARLTQDRVRNETRSELGQGAIPGLIDIMAGFGFLGVMYMGGTQIIAGEKTVGDFMAFFTAIGLAFEPLRRLGAISGLWQVAAAGVERIRALLATDPTILSPADPVAAPTGVPDIALQDVSLSYGDTLVLDGVTIRAEAGKTTALVGASGAGKTTVFNVLTRIVDVDAGQVALGGVAVDAMALPDLRGLISVVSQDAVLFDDSLRENILFGAETDDTRLQTALQDAHVSDFLPRLPDGLETQVGTGGSALSGGQRQRVAIARALLRDTPILLLDEATSALDAQSEAIVQEALDRLSKGRTTLVIAHRLSTVRNADKIIVMDRGRAVDSGTHDELLARGGLYADLYRLQFNETGSADKA